MIGRAREGEEREEEMEERVEEEMEERVEEMKEEREEETRETGEEKKREEEQEGTGRTECSPTSAPGLYLDFVSWVVVILSDVVLAWCTVGRVRGAERGREFPAHYCCE